jgi:hypothetical protein
MKLTIQPPSNAGVKNVGYYVSAPSYIFMVWCLTKQRDNFYLFTFYFTNTSTKTKCGTIFKQKSIAEFWNMQLRFYALAQFFHLPTQEGSQEFSCLAIGNIFYGE